MSNRFNIHKEIGEAINNYEEQSATPYISISDSSNMQVESSHFSINNKNSTSNIEKKVKYIDDLLKKVKTEYEMEKQIEPENNDISIFDFDSNK